jgi:hypothetical protein
MFFFLEFESSFLTDRHFISALCGIVGLMWQFDSQSCSVYNDILIIKLGDEATF